MARREAVSRKGQVRAREVGQHAFASCLLDVVLGSPVRALASMILSSLDRGSGPQTRFGERPTSPSWAPILRRALGGAALEGLRHTTAPDVVADVRAPASWRGVCGPPRRTGHRPFSRCVRIRPYAYGLLPSFETHGSSFGETHDPSFAHALHACRLAGGRDTWVVFWRDTWFMFCSRLATQQRVRFAPRFHGTQHMEQVLTAYRAPSTAHQVPRTKFSHRRQTHGHT